LTLRASCNETRRISIYVLGGVFIIRQRVFFWFSRLPFIFITSSPAAHGWF
jgi:hypothetical protein